MLRRGIASYTAAALATFPAVVHFAMVPHHFTDHGIYGWLFIADGVALVVAAIWLVATGGLWAWRSAGFVAAATVLAYVLSRTTGLPGLHDESWTLLGNTTTGAEALVAVGALMAGFAPAWDRSPLRARLRLKPTLIPQIRTD